MTVRLLPGVQRVSDGVWQWGNWEVSIHWFVGASGPHWMACNKDGLWSLTQDYRWLFKTLSRFGPDAVLVDNLVFRADEVAKS